MIAYIKKEFINDTSKLVKFLEYYEYCNIKVRSSYISFGRNEDSSPKSIVIYLKDNENLIVKDWATNQSADIFNYVIKSRNKTFRDVISVAKQIVGTDDYLPTETTHSAFQAFYSKIKHKQTVKLKTYDEEILNKYISCPNERFLKDGISMQVQHEFEIGYDVESQSITIPIRNETGQLIGVKCRRNYDVQDMKYWYDVPCQMSQTLYGYSENYDSLQGADIIYVFEAEKSVMQYISKLNKRNCVALGSGSISKKQAQLLVSLRASKIVLVHDVGYCAESVKSNLKTIMQCSRMSDAKLGFWNYFGKGYEDKISATDKDRDFLNHVLNNEIKYIERKIGCEKDKNTSRVD